jgi:hypothetical protein
MLVERSNREIAAVGERVLTCDAEARNTGSNPVRASYPHRSLLCSGLLAPPPRRDRFDPSGLPPEQLKDRESASK